MRFDLGLVWLATTLSFFGDKYGPILDYWGKSHRCQKSFFGLIFKTKKTYRYIIYRYILGYLGGELNRACVGNGTGAKSEGFAFNFWRKLLR